jgi:hypothetical protein
MATGKKRLNPETGKEFKQGSLYLERSIGLKLRLLFSILYMNRFVVHS